MQTFCCVVIPSSFAHLLQTNTCDDVDECTPSRCGEHTACTNLVGSYECACLSGYQFGNDIDCVDINECLESSTCAAQQNTFCVNQPGGFTCPCVSGFVKVDGVCERVGATLTFVLRLALDFNTERNNALLWSSLQTVLESSRFFPSFSDQFLAIEYIGIRYE